MVKRSRAEAMRPSRASSTGQSRSQAGRTRKSMSREASKRARPASSSWKRATRSRPWISTMKSTLERWNSSLMPMPPTMSTSSSMTNTLE
jgi:hypothetical protein